MLALKILGSWLKAHTLLSQTVETFEETQRRRLIQANFLAAGIMVIVCVSEILSAGLVGAKTHLLISLPIFGYYYLCHKIAKRSQNVRTLAQTWMAFGSSALWFDIAISGGLMAPSALLLFLLPIGAALILDARDIAALSIANILAILILTAFEVVGVFHAPSALALALPQAGLLIVNSSIISVTVIILTLHTNRLEKALRTSLADTLYMSDHDQLTGAYNRKWINQRMNALQGSDACHLFLIDLDGFKQVNDVHGHSVGDALLRAVVARLQSIRPGDAEIARLGGDEFLVLVEGKRADKARSLGQEIVKLMAQPFDINERELVISASVGFAAFPEDATTGDDLIARADIALYAGKASGRNQLVAFEPALEEKQQTRNSIIKRLRAAIERQDIYLDYQPQYDLGNGELIGFEALARWNDKELGVVPPNLFIPIVEECGLINQLGEDLLRRACRETRHWANLSAPASDVCVSVNLSPLQLSQLDIASVVQDILEEENFPAKRLELEITERVLIADPDLARKQLKKLAALGVGLALDNFGKQYSSLSCLQSLPLTRLKIDQSFVANIGQPKGKAFIQAIVQLAKALDLKVVAEGIETREQYGALKAMGCCYGQGYLFSPSVAPGQMLKMALRGDAVLRGDPVEQKVSKQA